MSLWKSKWKSHKLHEKKAKSSSESVERQRRALPRGKAVWAPPPPKLREVKHLVEIARPFASDMKLLELSHERNSTNMFPLRSFMLTDTVFVFSTILLFLFMNINHKYHLADCILSKLRTLKNRNLKANRLSWLTWNLNKQSMPLNTKIKLSNNDFRNQRPRISGYWIVST